MVLRDNTDVLCECMRDQTACLFGIFGVRIGDERDESREKEAGYGLVSYGWFRLQEERADAVGCDFRSLQGKEVSNNGIGEFRVVLE